MRILIVTQYFPPEMGAPQARLSELAVRLQDKGHAVTVLTAMPNYPTGRIFPGYRGKLRCREVVQKISVVRTTLYPSNSARSLPRLASYLSFAASSLALGTWGVGRQDVVLVESPPLFLAPSGWAIGRALKAKTVLMVSDIWPDILIRMGRPGESLGVRAMLWLERMAYRHFDVVALTNPGALQQIRSRFPGVAATVISNGVDTSTFSPALRNQEVRCRIGATDGEFLVGYCGLHGLAQGLDAVVHAAKRLQRESTIRFVLIGDGPVKQHLVSLAKELNVTNIRFFDPRPKKEMPSIVASCDAMLVPLVARLPGTMPSKIYEALASGTPAIVARGCEGETLVNQHRVGSTFEPMDGNGLARVIKELADDSGSRAPMRRQARELALRFDRDVLATRTERVLHAVVSGEPLPEVTW
jgi:glycosyltransferase involved in cell wall biosynthesis